MWSVLDSNGVPAKLGVNDAQILYISEYGTLQNTELIYVSNVFTIFKWS